MSVGSDRAELQDIRRRLGPYTALQDCTKPYALCDAEIARMLVRVILILDRILERMRNPP